MGKKENKNNNVNKMTSVDVRSEVHALLVEAEEEAKMCLVETVTDLNN